MKDKPDFERFEPVGEDGGEEFVRHTRDMGLWGAVLGPFMSRSSPILRDARGWTRIHI
jgi:hypothetical protein